MTDPCIFCDIANGEVTADVVYADDDVIAFRDNNPQAPTHVLVITREHYMDIEDLAQFRPGLAGALLDGARAVAEVEGLIEPGWRLVFNTGAGAGQTVFHVHGHVLGGRPFNWPPG
jgi:histidine triad (HIT) family protein